MIRSEVLKSLIPVISDHFVVCNIDNGRCGSTGDQLTYARQPP